MSKHSCLLGLYVTDKEAKKLYCFSMASLSSLVQYLGVSLEPICVGISPKY